MFINDSNVINYQDNIDVAITITTSFLLQNGELQANKQKKNNKNARSPTRLEVSISKTILLMRLRLLRLL